MTSGGEGTERGVVRLPDRLRLRGGVAETRTIGAAGDHHHTEVPSLPGREVEPTRLNH